MKKLILAALLILAFSQSSLAQSVRTGKVIISTYTAFGNTLSPAIGAQITVCAYNSSSYNNLGMYTGSVPCSPPTTVYSNSTFTQVQTQPFGTDSNANYFYWAAPGTYTECVSGAPVKPGCYAVTIGTTSGSGGSPGTPLTSFQINNSGLFGGSSFLYTTSGSSKYMNINGAGGSLIEWGVNNVDQPEMLLLNSGGYDTEILVNEVSLNDSSNNFLQLFSTGILSGNGGNYITISPPASFLSNWTWHWPNGPGTIGQALETDGAGNTSWNTITAAPGAPVNSIQANIAGVLAGTTVYYELDSGLYPTLGSIKADPSSYNANLLWQVIAQTSSLLWTANIGQRGNDPAWNLEENNSSTSAIISWVGCDVQAVYSFGTHCIISANSNENGWAYFRNETLPTPYAHVWSLYDRRLSAVGTPVELYWVDVLGNIHLPVGSIYDSTGGVGGSGQVLSSLGTGLGTKWITPSSGGSVSGQANQVIPLGCSATSICAQSSLSDNGTQVTGTEPIVAPSISTNGSASGLHAFQGSATLPPLTGLTTGYQGWIGASSAASPSWFGQLPAAAPAGSILKFGTPSSNVSTGTWVPTEGSGANIPTAGTLGASSPVCTDSGSTLQTSGCPGVPTVVDTSTPVTVSTTNPAEFHFNENATAGTAITYQLPTAAAGKQFCFSNAYNGSAANTGTLELLTSASGQFIIFTDGTLSATGGYVISGGAAADAACVAGVDSTHWMLYVQRGTWAKH
jgi:hypothetical protein